VKRTVVVTVVVGLLFGYGFSRLKNAIAAASGSIASSSATANQPAPVLDRTDTGQRATDGKRRLGKQLYGKALTVLLDSSGLDYSTSGDEPLGRATGRNDELEAILDYAPSDVDWMNRLEPAVKAAIADDPTVQLENIRCVSEFCSLQLSKPIDSTLDWPEIDDRFTFIDGEKIFRAGADGKMSTAFVYFSAREGGLPLTILHPARTAEEGT
jgi:hypothetical protein